jgi:hypothetical protein
MYRKQVPFQLEKTVPGAFLTQGLLGGVLGGFVAAVVGAIVWGINDLGSALQLLYLAVFISGITSVIKATVIWGLYRLTGFQMRAVARLAVASIGSSLFVAFLALLEFEGKFLSGCLIWLLFVGTPVALLVGSRVKPWAIFTFGGVTARKVNQRSSLSNSNNKVIADAPNFNHECLGSRFAQWQERVVL